MPWSIPTCTFSGEATNLIPVLFADSLNSQDAALNFTAKPRADAMLDIGELLALSDPTEEELEDAQAAGTTDSLTRRGIERRATGHRPTRRSLRGQELEQLAVGRAPRR